jgi:RNA polymerase sigma-70 factor (ECF subfamily)
MIAPAHFSAPSSAPAGQSDAASRLATSRQEALYDAELVRRFNAGDEAAFVEIVNRHRERLFALALGMLKNRGDAEEIAQDVFVRAHRGLAKFRGDASLATWLHHITLNLARNRYWYFFRRRRHSTLSLDCTCRPDAPGTFTDLVAADAASPAREAVVTEFTELIAACMTRLAPPQRQILTLRNSLNRSYGEIASDLSISVGTVKSRIARARGCLRLLLVESCPELGPDASPASWFDSDRCDGGIVAAVA